MQCGPRGRVGGRAARGTRGSVSACRRFRQEGAPVSMLGESPTTSRRADEPTNRRTGLVGVVVVPRRSGRRQRWLSGRSVPSQARMNAAESGRQSRVGASSTYPTGGSTSGRPAAWSRAHS
jgi:hypothetical protein